MPQVVAVRLRYNPKQLWFDPAQAQPHEGDHVIVSTERGTEIGLAVSDPFEVTQEQIDGLASPLKPVLRVASEDDLVQAEELVRKGEEAMPYFNELVTKYRLDMKPVRVEYLFGGEKAVFYFVSEDRIDFRELVRDLAARFHTRIDMRQIGVRDEARLVGGIAHCGQELCCARMGGEFQPVSIRMAKEQDLSLNPLKISGVCGRLMCCLRYEFEAYKDFKGRAPKKGALIETPLGMAKVVEFDTPRESVTLRLEDGKSFQIPISLMDCPKAQEGEGAEPCRPCKVSRKALETINSSAIQLALGALEREEEREALIDEALNSSRTLRRRGNRGAKAPEAQAAKEETPSTTDVPAKADPSSKKDRKPQKRQKNGLQEQGSSLEDRSAKTPAPAPAAKADTSVQKSKGKSKQAKASAPEAAEKTPKAAAAKTEPSASKAKPKQPKKGKSADTSAPAPAAAEKKQAAKPKPRPGQHSSNVRNSRPADPAPTDDRRRRRRRSSNPEQASKE
ncbi:MAG: hypothetical protein IJH83_07915 [Coriobacteriales bacterium]|nr:hypothetical protein [Coriobacteriales bacterium]